MSACPVCNSSDIRPYAEVDSYNFSRCGACNFVFLTPMPTDDELRRLYDADRKVGPESAETYPKARSRMRRSRLKAVRLLPYIFGKKVLDVGCGGGFMVEAMRRAGADATGLDIDRAAIAYARHQFPRNRFYCEDISTFLGRGETFDFIYSSEVFEHVPEINMLCESIARMLKPGGRLYLTTPDIGHATVPRDVTQWPLFAPPVHVQFFDRHNMTLFLGRHGLEVQKVFRNRKAGLQVLARRLAPSAT